MPTLRTGEMRLRRLVSVSAAATLTTAYTVPENWLVEIEKITVCNTDTVYRYVTVKLADRAVFSGTRLGPAGGAESTIDWEGVGHYLHAGETIKVMADAASVVDVLVSGGERKDQ